MPLEDVPVRSLVIGFSIGAIAVFVIVLLIALAMGADALIAFLVALFGGLVVGGSTGFIVAGRRVSARI